MAKVGWVHALKGPPMATVSASDLPADSLLRPWLATATFWDSFDAPLADPSLAPIEILQRASKATPDWAVSLMSIRNRVVKPLGLKTGPAFRAGVDRPAADYEIGDRIGLFTLFAKTENEVVVGIDDRHLDVRVSVMKFARAGAARFAFSTVVKTHNLLGRLYMVPVGRIHPIIVWTLMNGAQV
jgi:hypothetical protein